MLKLVSSYDNISRDYEHYVRQGMYCSLENELYDVKTSISNLVLQLEASEFEPGHPPEELESLNAEIDTLMARVDEIREELRKLEEQGI